MLQVWKYHITIPLGDGSDPDRLVNEKNLQQHLWKHGRVSLPANVISGSRHKEMNVFGKSRRVRGGQPGAKSSSWHWKSIRCPPGRSRPLASRLEQGGTDNGNSATAVAASDSISPGLCSLSGCQPQVKLTVPPAEPSPPSFLRLRLSSAHSCCSLGLLACDDSPHPAPYTSGLGTEGPAADRPWLEERIANRLVAACRCCAESSAFGSWLNGRGLESIAFRSWLDRGLESTISDLWLSGGGLESPNIWILAQW